MKTIAVANQKGGCAKTTTAINLAGAMVSLGKKVLVIDLDPQSHASFGLGVTSQAIDKSIYNVLTDNAGKRRAIHDCIINASRDLDVVPSNILLSTIEQELKDKEDAVSRLYHVLKAGDLIYDYCIIDCPPSLGFLTFNALRASEEILVPIDMSTFSLMGVGKLLGMLELIKLKICHAPRVNALATIFDKRTKYSITMLNEIKTFFKAQMLETIIRVSVSLKKAASSGMPAAQFDSKSNGAIDHLNLAKEILKLDGVTDFTKPEPALREAKEKPAVVVVPAPVIPLPEVAKISASGVEETFKQMDALENSSDETESPVRQTIFTIHAPDAKDIYLVGDFNHWKINDTSRLEKSDNSRWEKKIELPGGRYRYKFVVDGEWTIDSQNSEKEANPFGTFDSILDIKPFEKTCKG